VPRLPLLRLLAPFAFGIWGEDRVHLGASFWGSASLGCAACLAFGLWRTRVADSTPRALAGLELLLGFALGALALGTRLDAVPPTATSAAGLRSFQVQTEPRGTYSGCSARIWVAPTRSGARGGAAHASLPKAACGLHPGQWVLGSLRFVPLLPSRNPGGLDARLRARRRGVRVHARVEGDRLAAAPARGLGVVLRTTWLGFRTRLGDVLDPLASEPPLADDERAAGGLLRALVTGERERLTSDVRRTFEQAGLSHLLAVSGLHVGFVFGAVKLVLAWLLRRARSRRWLRSAEPVSVGVGMLAALAYAGLTGFGLPALRAAAMGLAGAFALLAGRPGARWNALAGAGWICLVSDPASLFEPSLWLSFSAVAGILVWKPGSSWLSGMLGATCAASLATAPCIAQLGGVLPIGALLANLFAIPWFGWVLVPSAVLAALTELALEALHSPSLDPAHAALELARVAARWGIAWAELSGSPDLLRGFARPEWAAFGICGLGFGARLAWRGQVRAGGGLALAAVLALLVGFAPPPQLGWGEAQVWILDVGHGDAIVLRSRQQSWLVDAGPRSETYDAGRAVVVPALRAVGVRRLDGIIVTHADRDHIGGVRSVIEALPVSSLWWTRQVSAHPEGRRLANRARGLGVALGSARAGMRLGHAGDLSIEVLWPPAEGSFGSSNAGSLVLRVQVGRECVVLSGDAPRAVELRLLERVAGCRVLKLGHHGSRSASAPAWLDAVNPEVVIASAGTRRRGSLPHPEVRRDLFERHLTLYETWRHGALELRLRASEEPALVVIPWRSPSRYPGEDRYAGEESADLISPADDPE